MEEDNLIYKKGNAIPTKPKADDGGGEMLLFLLKMRNPQRTPAVAPLSASSNRKVISATPPFVRSQQIHERTDVLALLCELLQLEEIKKSYYHPFFGFDVIRLLFYL